MIESVRPSAVMAANLDRLANNRLEICSRVRTLHEDTLWMRPSADKWAAAEHLVHLNRTLSTFVSTLQIVTPILYPLAWWNRSKDYETSLRDYFDPLVYKPLKTAAMLDPKQHREPLEKIEADFLRGMSAARNYFLSLDERIAGNMKFPYPPSKGSISVLQLTFSLGYHERHHFRAMAKLEPSLNILEVTD